MLLQVRCTDSFLFGVNQLFLCLEQIFNLCLQRVSRLFGADQLLVLFHLLRTGSIAEIVKRQMSGKLGSLARFDKGVFHQRITARLREIPIHPSYISSIERNVHRAHGFANRLAMLRDQDKEKLEPIWKDLDAICWRLLDLSKSHRRHQNGFFQWQKEGVEEDDVFQTLDTVGQNIVELDPIPEKCKMLDKAFYAYTWKWRQTEVFSSCNDYGFEAFNDDTHPLHYPMLGRRLINLAPDSLSKRWCLATNRYLEHTPRYNDAKRLVDPHHSLVVILTNEVKELESNVE